MSQNAIVKKVVHPGVVEVSLMRQMECGLSCSSCEGCPQRPKEEILALASDPQGGAKPGDWVEVEPASGSAIGFALLVFFLPCVFLLGGYLIGRLLGLGDGGSIGMAAAGLVLLRSGGPDQPDHHPAEDPGIHRAGVSSQRVRRALCLDMSGLSGRN